MHDPERCYERKAKPFSMKLVDFLIREFISSLLKERKGKETVISIDKVWRAGNALTTLFVWKNFSQFTWVDIFFFKYHISLPHRYAPHIMRLVDQTGYLLSSYRFTSLVDNVAVIKCDYEQVTVSGNPTKRN